MAVEKQILGRYAAEIQGDGKGAAEMMRERRRGRIAAPEQPIWCVDPFSRRNSVTSAVISMCIKEDFGQTLEELAERLSRLKSRPKGECLAVLRELRQKGTLGYFDDEFTFRVWTNQGKEKENAKGVT